MSDPTPSPIVPPPAVDAIFDKAIGPDDHPFAATLRKGGGGVQLINARTKEVLEDVDWPQADEYFRNILINGLHAINDSSLAE